MKKRTIGFSALLVVGVILFILGLLLLILFPIVIYPAAVKSQLPISQGDDGSSGTSTQYWLNLPADEFYDFYFFNITNIDEMLYRGEPPRVVEVGPYSYLESEFKEAVAFSDDKNAVYYRNNKSWTFLPDRSCPTCTTRDLVYLPNAAYMTTVFIRTHTDNLNPVLALGLDILMILLGEYPVRGVSTGGILFDAYNDPLVNLLNSQLTDTIKRFFNGTLAGIPVPDITDIGYFPKYNHTNDEDYVVRTGKADVGELAHIVTWAGSDSLSWWGEDVANISGSTDGVLNKPFLDKHDELKNFQSFSCRWYNMHYSREEVVDGISTYVYKMDRDQYDSNKYVGYRYENEEMVDYFPSWPNCGNKTVDPPVGGCDYVDCSVSDFFCSPCCQGSHYNGTVLLPPGVVPLRCFPGRNKRLPFSGFLSPPHFVSSPEEVTGQIVGIQPNSTKHDPLTWYINPTTGSAVKAQFQMQLIIPIYIDTTFTQLLHTTNMFIPSLWASINVQMKDYAHDYILFNTKTLPTIAMAIGIVFTIVGIVATCVGGICLYRGSKKSSSASISTSSTSSRHPSTHRTASIPQTDFVHRDPPEEAWQ